MVYEDHIKVQLKADVDSLLKTGVLPEDAANFNSGTENIENTLIQSSKNHEDKVFRVHVISNGEPMEIFTEAGGSVIFRKYSPAGEQSAIAADLCEALYRTSGRPAAICDRDSIIAAAGPLRRELENKPISPALDAAMQTRQLQRKEGVALSPGVAGAEAAVIAPVIAGGDLCGCVALLQGEAPLGESEARLVQAAALFFSRQMEG